MFYNNGVIVQNIIKQLNTNEKYMGLSRYKSWPLEGCDGTEVKKINESLYNQWLVYYNYNGSQVYNINSIKSYELLQSYIKLCKNSDLRIICVETEYDFYDRMDVDLNKEILGFDFIYPTCDFYSAIGDEYDVVEDLGFKYELNNYGLFDDIEQLRRFIETRNNRQKELNIEPNDDFLIVRVSRVLM